MAGLGYKDFTAGAVLTAAQVDGYLMEQSVMNFAGTAARGSALASVLSAGQVAHVGGGTVTIYDGTAWTGLSDLSLITAQTFTSVASVDVINCFSATFKQYRVAMEFQTSGTATVTMRFRDSGGAISAANYSNRGVAFLATAASGASELYNGTALTSITIVNSLSPSVRQTLMADLAQCGSSGLPTYAALSPGNAGIGHIVLGSGGYGGTITATGVQMNASTGNMSGRIAIYGYRGSV